MPCNVELKLLLAAVLTDVPPLLPELAEMRDFRAGTFILVLVLPSLWAIPVGAGETAFCYFPMLGLPIYDIAATNFCYDAILFISLIITLYL